MTLLLTSAGLTTDTLRNKFIELLTKKPDETSVAFITTASKVEKDTSYVDKDLDILQKIGIAHIEIIDISQPKETWEKHLKASDVIWVEGGNTFYLLHELQKASLDKDLRQFVGNKLYVGVSAGSIIVTPTIAIASVEPADSNDVDMVDFTGLGWVPFEVSPHTPDLVPLSNVRNYAKTISNKLFAYDDTVAVLVVNDKTEFIGEGFHEVLVR